jgi:hypothetical protein
MTLASEWILKKENEKSCTRLICFRARTSGVLYEHDNEATSSIKWREFLDWLRNDLVASLEGLGFMELVTAINQVHVY